MATASISDFVDHRVQTLASVVLTRRREMTVTPIDVGPLDLLVQITRSQTVKGEEIDSLLPFFCILKGTEQELPTPGHANRHIKTLWNKPSSKKTPHYSLPVLILLFSMVDDQGYSAWYSYPKLKIEGPEIDYPETFRCESINRISTDVIMRQVVEWYDALADMVIQD